MREVWGGRMREEMCVHTQTPDKRSASLSVLSQCPPQVEMEDLPDDAVAEDKDNTSMKKGKSDRKHKTDDDDDVEVELHGFGGVSGKVSHRLVLPLRLLTLYCMCCVTLMTLQLPFSRWCHQR